MKSLKNKEEKLYRALPYKHFANKSKLKTIRILFKLYQKDANTIFKYIWEKFIKSKTPITKRENIKQIKTILSERYKYTIFNYLVYPTYSSYLEIAKNYIKNLITHSTLSEENKLQLYILNKRGLWLNPPDEIQIKVKKENKEETKTIKISQQNKHLIKKLFHRYLKTNKIPKFNNAPLIVDNKTGEFQQSKTSKKFKQWIRLSTHIKRQVLYIPVEETDYYNQRKGKDTNIFHITKNDLGTIEIKRVKEIKKENTDTQENIIALDFGLKSLFTTNKGDLLGRNFFEKIKEYADKIDKLQRNLQRQKINPKQSKRYIKLNFKLKQFTKNEIRRIINRIVERYKLSIILVENLKYFLKQVINKFPNSVKRALIRIGRKEIKNKLKEISEEYGIQVVEINPAYSSQTCNNCGYVDKENRKTQEKFECRLCGYKLNADVQASRNLIKRFDKGMFVCGRKQALRLQIEEFIANLQLERYKCLWSKALRLLTQNPYFKGLSDSSLT
ncbi:RNA-guided endonuclease InsQ/TnpB family protein [Sulfurihydrogenibium subterraneum]|uniref:RNA-guided endonuclease InsQ/TnpB family protein n=1 Tax=Sulfurihydrogenibium subterraneum TaxID=171121 RepID=UPI00048EDD18|nr:RNA-guided endonuclease TnpB family protein [Sulfurihydrogenibium subterraneum]